MKAKPLTNVITDLVRKYVDQEITRAVFVKSRSHKLLDQKTGEYRDSNAAENLADLQETIADDVMSSLRDALIDSGLIVAERLGDPELAIDFIMREAQTILDMENDGFLNDSLGLPRNPQL